MSTFQHHYTRRIWLLQLFLTCRKAGRLQPRREKDGYPNSLWGRRALPAPTPHHQPVGDDMCRRWPTADPWQMFPWAENPGQHACVLTDSRLQHQHVASMGKEFQAINIEANFRFETICYGGVNGGAGHFHVSANDTRLKSEINK